MAGPLPPASRQTAGERLPTRGALEPALPRRRPSDLGCQNLLPPDLAGSSTEISLNGLDGLWEQIARTFASSGPQRAFLIDRHSTFLSRSECVNIGPKVICAVRLRLAIDHREATRVYSEAVCKMTDLLGLGLESEVSLLRRVCRIEWEASEKARLTLARHEADHFCDRDSFIDVDVASA